MKTPTKLLVLCLVAAPAFSQTLPTSAIYGTVTDQSGTPLVDATVELRGTTLIGGTYATTTAIDGLYRFAVLPSGSYEVTARYPGLATVVRPDVAIPPGAAIRIDLELRLAPIDQQISVAGRAPLIDVSNPSIATHIDNNFLQHLPTRRSLGEILNMAPGVVRNFESGGAAYGGTLSSNAVLVEGVDVTEPRRQRLWLPLNYNWIEEAGIAAIGSGVTYGKSTGASAAIVLRAGGNLFNGLGEYMTTRQRWVDDNSGNGTPRRIAALWDASIQSGGPARRDRLWYFAGVQYYRLADTPAGYRGDDVTSLRNPRTMVRLTAAPRRDWRVDGLWLRSGATRHGVGVGQFASPEATSIGASIDNAWNARATWARRRTVVEARAGGFAGSSRTDPTPPASREGPPARIERTTNILSGNAASYSSSEPSRWSAAFNMTQLYLTGSGTSHELVIGAEHEWSSSLEEQGFPGNLRYFTMNGVPVTAIGFSGATMQAFGRQTMLYVEDRWQAASRVAVTGGIRAELNRASIPVDGTLLSTSPLAPRVGLAWDLAANHRTAVKVHFGRYFDALLTNRVAFMDITRQSRTIVYSVSATGDLVQVAQSAPLTARAIDPDIGQSYVDQLSAGIEHQFGEAILMQAHYLHRRFDQFMGMTDTGSQWVPATVQDPGPDGRSGTSDDGPVIAAYRNTNPGQEFLFYTNPDEAFRRYEAVQFVGRHRNTYGLDAQVSYTWSRNRGTVGNQDNVNAGLNDLGDLPLLSGAGVFMSPNARINAEGRAVFDLSEFKALGTYRIAALDGFVVGAAFRYETGVRWERSINLSPGVLAPLQFVVIRAEPRGSRSLPAVKNLDLRLQKTVRLHRHRVALMADVFNVTNQGTPIAAFGVSGSSFGQVLNRMDPRQLRIALRVDF